MTSTQTALVTGANGYISGHIIKNLLEDNINVIGTVRSFNKAANLISLFPDQFKNGQLQFIEVDFNDVESIKRIFKNYHNITRVIHPAQYFAKEAKTAEELDLKLIKYTEKSLDSIIDIVEKSDSPIERFVLFSTSVAVRGPIVDYTKTFTENDFADLTHAEAVKSWMSAYTYAKVKAEKKVLGFKSSRGIQYKVIVPPTVLGPLVSFGDKESQLNTNNVHLYKLFRGEAPSVGIEWWADVRNVADAAVQASDKLKTPSTVHNRYVIVDGVENYFDALKVYLKNFSEYNPGNWEELVKRGEEIYKDRKISKRDLKITESEIDHRPISFEKTVIDTAKFFVLLDKER